MAKPLINASTRAVRPEWNGSGQLALWEFGAGGKGKEGSGRLKVATESELARRSTCARACIKTSFLPPVLPLLVF